MTDSARLLLHPKRPFARGGLVAAVLAAAVLAACGGGDDDDDDDDSASLQQTPATCAALNGRTIAASAIGEPSTGAVVTSATYVSAVPDTINAAGTAVTQGLPDYCRLLIDIKPVDPAAPLIKSQVNLPTNWNGKKLQFGGGGYNGTLVTGLGALASAPGPTCRCR